MLESGGLIGDIESNTNIDAQYSVVSFAGACGWKNGSYYGYATVQQDWTSSASDAVSAIRRLKADGGTNYQKGIEKGNEQLAKSSHTSRNATTFVIFVTDGEPTTYGDNDTGNGEFFDSNALIAAQRALKDTNCDYFYAIGIGNVFESPYGQYTDAYKHLDSLKGYVGGNIPGSSTIGHTYAASDDMTEVFDRILSDVTFFAANNVVMTDPLSQYADIVPNADGNWDFTVTIDDGETPQTIPVMVEKEKGSATFTFTDSKGTKQTAIVEYTEATKTIKLTFPAEYQLEEGYTYSISTTITPSQKAKDDGMEGNSEAQQTPDENTGTHWDNQDEDGNPEKGFWSNDNENAKVTYKAITTDENGNETSSTEGFAMFPKPVIQVQEETTANLTIVKNIYGLSQQQVVDLVEPDGGENGLRFDVDFFNNEDDAKKDNHGNENGIEGDWTFSVSDTIDYNDGTGNWEENIDISTGDIWPGNNPEEEMSHYVGPVLTAMQDSTTGETYYQYSITIEGVKLKDWYHVWELNTGVTGYNLEASVKAVNADGEIKNIAENTHDGQATAFQLTDDTTVTFTNRYTHSPVTVNFKKVDATYHAQGLAGAEFKLFYIENGENKYYSNANDWTATEGDAKVFTSVDGGTLTLPELEVGRTYFLTEVTAPDGYQLLTKNIQIVVGADGDIDAVEYVGGGALGTVGGDQGSTDTTTPPTYLIPNTTGTELPETGGRGTNFLTIGGLLMMAAAAGGYVLRRRRGKEAR